METVFTVFRKELQETLRDRRTLLIMIVVPILLYPVMFIAFEQLALFGARQVASEPAHVGVAGDVDEDLIGFLADVPHLRVSRAPAAAPGRIRDTEIHALAVVRRELGADASSSVTIYYDEADSRSTRARRVLANALDEWAEHRLEQRLSDLGLPASFARPLIVNDSSIAGPADRGGYWLGRFLPLLLVMITLLGAFYPAIDLAAGEKERGTLETLLTTPTPPGRILAGKFLTVSVIGVFAAGLNLASMLFTLRAGLFQSVGQLGMEVVLPARSVFLIFGALIPLSVLFAGLFLGVAVRAHSFKEAQNTLTPIYIVVILPAMLPMVPGIDFGPMLALVPIAGVSLLFRDLMGGGAPLLPAALALISTAAYAAAALAFAAHAFGREDVLFGADAAAPPGKSGWAAFIERLGEREGRRPGLLPAFGLVVGVGALYFYVGRTLQLAFGLEGVLTGILASQWLLMFLPAAAFIALGGFDARASLSLTGPSGRQLLAALLIIAGGIPVGWAIVRLQMHFLPVPEDLLRGLEQLLTARTARQVLVLLVVVAVTPAICEEMVFRGVLLGGMRDRLSPAAAIGLNAVVFGAFHLSYESALRFLPTAWLGLLIAWVVWRTGSIWTGVAMHFANNATLVLLMASPAALAWLGGPAGEVRVEILLAAGGALAAGLLLLRASHPNSATAPDAAGREASRP